MRKVLIFLLLSIICVFVISSTSLKQAQAKASYYGGEIVLYNLCIINDNTLSVDFPLFSEKPITSLSLIKIDNDDFNEDVTYSLHFDASNKYIGNHFVNYFTMKFKDKNKETDHFTKKKFKYTVDGLFLSINKEDIKYKTPNFTLCNSNYVLKEDENLSNFGEFQKVDKEQKLSLIPQNESMATSHYEVNKNTYLISIKTADYYNINKCLINDIKYDPDNIYENFHDHTKLTLDYSLTYKNNMYKNYITRSYFVITYVIDCEVKKYISNHELYVQPDDATNSSFDMNLL